MRLDSETDEQALSLEDDEEMDAADDEAERWDDENEDETSNDETDAASEDEDDGSTAPYPGDWPEETTESTPEPYAAPTSSLETSPSELWKDDQEREYWESQDISTLAAEIARRSSERILSQFRQQAAVEAYYRRAFEERIRNVYPEEVVNAYRSHFDEWNDMNNGAAKVTRQGIEGGFFYALYKEAMATNNRREVLRKALRLLEGNRGSEESNGATTPRREAIPPHQRTPSPTTNSSVVRQTRGRTTPLDKLRAIIPSADDDDLALLKRRR